MTMSGPPRGYAMMMVLLVLLILALSMGSLVWHLGANVAETRRVITTIRAESACASALDAAGRVMTATFKGDPSADPETLLGHICKVPGGNCQTDANGIVLPLHLAPKGSEVIYFTITAPRLSQPTTRRILSGPFVDRFAVENAVIVVAGMRDVKTGRRCTQTDRYVVPSLPITNFPIFGVANQTRWSPRFTVRRANDGPPSRIHLNGNAGGYTTSDFAQPSAQFTGDQQAVNLTTSTKQSDQILRPRVAAPTMSAKQNGLTHSFRWLVDVPRAADSTTQRQARLAAEADIVIIDGVWYFNRDKSAPWPGKPIFSEHAGVSVTLPSPADGIVENTDTVGLGDFGYAPGEFPKRYSWYDRATSSGPVRDQFSTLGAITGCDPSQSTCGSRGVISYGPLHVNTSATSCVSDADCTTSHPECYRAGTGNGVCIGMEPGSWSDCGGSDGFHGLSQCSDASARVKATIDGTRSGFFDNGKRILPINFNVREFTDALKSSEPNELGAVLGTPADFSRFNGIVYITSRFTSTDYPRNAEHSNGNDMPGALCFKDNGASGFRRCPGNAATNTDTFAPLSQHVVPVGLCGTQADITGGGSGDFQRQPCNSASRPNAVRVYGAGVVDPGVFRRGLTIVTDLPLYVYGDVNRVQANKPHVKVALVGDRITFQSRGWRDRQHPWFDTSVLSAAEKTTLLGSATPTATGVMVVESSLITGVPLRNSSTHDIGDVFRTTQAWNNNFFILRGHLTIGFNSEWFRDVGDDDDDDDDGPGDDTNDQGNDVRTVAPGLRWLPDFHLDNPAFQPPGTPLVSLPPTSRARSR